MAHVPSRLRHPAVALAAALACAGASAASGSFTITGSSTTSQSLGANQTGSVTAGSSLTVSGSSVAVSVTGSNASLTNLGTISQTGTGRVVRDNTGVQNLVVTNGSATNTGATMRSADADVVQMNVANASVSLTNYGTMISANASKGGAQVVDFAAITNGANVVNNYGLMQAAEADAVRPGTNGVVNNWGTILSTTTTGSSSDGIDGQSANGFQVFNYGAASIEGGRHGITGGQVDAASSFSATISNLGSIIGDNGSGINLDGFNGRQLVTIVNGGTIAGRGVTGDGDGVDVDGLVDLTNTGTIRSVNSFSAIANGPAFSEGITVGGGRITNSGTIEGLVAAGNTNAYGRGITLSGNDITSGVNAGKREGIYGDALVTNNAGGLIRGQNDSAIVAEGLASGHTVTILNNAGATIRGGSATAAAIRTGLDDDTVTNAGTIDGSSSGKAVDLGAGNNTFAIVGGSAVVLGDVSGGIGGHNAMTIDPGAGNAFAYAGSLSNFDSVDVRSGTVTFSGASTYAGTTRLSGGTLVLVGAGRLSAASALALDGGTLQLVGAAGVDGQRFASLALGGDSTLDLGGSAVTFDSLATVTAGKTLAIIDEVAGSPGYAIRFAGDLTGSAGLQALLAATTVDGLHVKAHFDGAFTDVTAVPEPGSVALLLAGLGLVGVVARRRQA